MAHQNKADILLDVCFIFCVVQSRDSNPKGRGCIASRFGESASKPRLKPTVRGGAERQTDCASLFLVQNISKTIVPTISMSLYVIALYNFFFIHLSFTYLLFTVDFFHKSRRNYACWHSYYCNTNK